MKHILVKVLYWLVTFISIFAVASNAGACWIAFYQVEVPQKPK